MLRQLLNEPFGIADPVVIDRLTDRQVYDWYFRRHDAEADAEEAVLRTTAADEGKPLAQKHDEYVAVCRSFGFSNEEAEAEWRKWVAEQGG